MIIVNCPLFHKEMQMKGVEEYPLYKSYGFFQLRIGRFFRKLHLNFFNNLNRNYFSSNSQTVIIFDNGMIDAKEVLSFIANNNVGKRLIFYYWNPVERSVNPSCIPSVYEKWSYSPKDCKKYGMKYNSTFYFDCLIPPKVVNGIDVFFAGKDKGRKKELLNLKKIFDSYGVTNRFYITATHPKFQRKGYDKAISYNDLLKLTNESRCILDFYFYPDAGLSLRAMEGLFLEKKIITNNKTYKEYDFYKKENVFIIEENDMLNLIEFVKEAFAKINDSMKNEYLFENWKNRF